MRSLQGDTSGAIMVIALFMAMIAVGALYYMAGLGDAILAQERMQDAADAAAFSSAVVHARGMNVLALINIMMASLLAILVLLSMLSSLFKVAVVILAAVSWFVPPAAGWIPTANKVSKGFSKAEEKAKGPVQETVKALHKLQGPLSKAIPMLASVNAASLSTNTYGEVVDFGVTFPIMDGLPTRAGSFKKLCEKAGQYAGEMAVAPINAAIPYDFLTKRLKKGAAALGKKYAEFYCGDGPKPKAKLFEEKVAIPELDTKEGTSCKTNHDDLSCEKYEKQLEEIKHAYTHEWGECRQGSQVEDLCHDMRLAARTECNPKTSKLRIRSSTWAERRYTRRWVVKGEGDSARVVEEARDRDNDVYRKGDKKTGYSPGVRYSVSSGFSPPKADAVPCGSSYYYGDSPMSKWDASADDDKAVCASKVETPTLKSFEGLNPKVIEIQVLEVVDVLRCVVKKTIESELNGTALTQKEKKGMLPQEMCSCAELGEESFQVRSIVIGSQDKYTKNSDQKILVATKGRHATQSKLAELSEYAGRVAAAQAEYYYNDANTPRGEWLWNMKWRARMRRLAFKREPFQCKVKDNCNIGQAAGGKDTSGGAIGKVKDLLGKADNIIVH